MSTRSHRSAEGRDTGCVMNPAAASTATTRKTATCHDAQLQQITYFAFSKSPSPLYSEIALASHPRARARAARGGTAGRK